MPARNAAGTGQNRRFDRTARRKEVCGFARCVRSHAAAVQASSASMCRATRRRFGRSRGVSRGTACGLSRETQAGLTTGSWGGRGGTFLICGRSHEASGVPLAATAARRQQLRRNVGRMDGRRLNWLCGSRGVVGRVLLSTKQATALKPRVDPLGTNQPEAAIGLSERVDLHVGEVDAPLAEGPEGFNRSLKKVRSEFLVRQNLADDQLNRLLRHGSHAVRRRPRFRVRSRSLPPRRRKSNVAAAV